jgi:hypothetical protein
MARKTTKWVDAAQCTVLSRDCKNKLFFYCTNDLSLVRVDRFFSSTTENSAELGVAGIV